MNIYLNATFGVSAIISSFFIILGACNGLQGLISKESRNARNSQEASKDFINNDINRSNLQVKRGIVYAYWDNYPKSSLMSRFNPFEVANIHLIVFTSVSILLILSNAIFQVLK